MKLKEKPIPVQAVYILLNILWWPIMIGIISTIIGFAGFNEEFNELSNIFLVSPFRLTLSLMSGVIWAILALFYFLVALQPSDISRWDKWLFWIMAGLSILLYVCGTIHTIL